MKKVTVKKMIDKRMKKIAGFYNLVNKDCTEVNIHELRIAIKKLRAFLNLLSIGTDAKSLIVIHPILQQLYGMIGEVRNMQLQKKRLRLMCGNNHLKVPFKYYNYLEKREMVLIQQLHSTNFDLEVVRNTAIQSIDKKVGKDALTLYTKHFCETLNQLAAMPFDDKRMHEIRRLFKDFIYNERVFKKHKNKLPINFDKKTIETFAGKLGDYQDLFSSLYITWYFSISSYVDREIDLIMPVHNLILNQKLAMKASISKELQELVLNVQLL